jgi:OmpA-OmpF porin, OOP family
MMRITAHISGVAALAVVAALASAGPAAAADLQGGSGKKVLHNASVQEIVEQLSRGRQKPKTRGLTIAPPAGHADAMPESGCYVAGARAKARGLTVMPEPQSQTGAHGAMVASAAPGAAVAGTDCHPGYISLIHFAYDSSRLQAESKRELDNIASALKTPVLEQDRFVIAGHTDSAGSDPYNLALSERRAAAVVRYLASRSVDTGRLIAEGRGERELLDKKDPLSAINRRVEIINASR